jgi:uroporphyrinogen decarboxylase
MISAGLDALHALQPDANGMDPAGIKADFGSEIVLHGAIDSKRILIHGSSREYVREETRRVLQVMKPGGMYIAGASHDSSLEETPLENALAMFDAIGAYGQY